MVTDAERVAGKLLSFELSEVEQFASGLRSQKSQMNLSVVAEANTEYIQRFL